MSTFNCLIQKLLQQALPFAIEIFDAIVLVDELVCLVDCVQEVVDSLIPLRLRYKRLWGCLIQP